MTFTIPMFWLGMIIGYLLGVLSLVAAALVSGGKGKKNQKKGE